MNAAARVPPLFEIAVRLRAEFDNIDANEGEVSAFCEAMLDELGLALEQKCEAYAAVRRMLMAEADAVDELAAHYTKIANAKRAKIEHLEARVQVALELSGVKRAVGPTGGAVLKENPAHVELLVSEAQVPPEWFRVVPERMELDKKRISAALKAGTKLEFAVLERTVKLDWK